ncbi:TPA: hypothetical protein I7E55_002038 [Vibrio cholerae]|nr:hypothetical protein [Vibrio cholerae]
MKASPFQLGIAAHKKGVEIAAHDEELIEWLKQTLLIKRKVAFAAF